MTRRDHIFPVWKWRYEFIIINNLYSSSFSINNSLKFRKLSSSCLKFIYKEEI
jgi:hypothetical protein